MAEDARGHISVLCGTLPAYRCRINGGRFPVIWPGVIRAAFELVGVNGYGGTERDCYVFAMVFNSNVAFITSEIETASIQHVLLYL